ncbi:MAG: Ribosomal protein [Candidatus Nomurabacteria bacterium]|nr:Ribosomal protein [Candidatus Nomurabacteria bacterium]
MSEENRTYELGFILVPTVPESEVDQKVAELKAAVAAAGGTVGAEGTTEFIDLAYRIEKNVKSKKMKWTQGYFGWMKFTAAPESQAVLKKALDANLELMRYMLIKTSAENLVQFKKPKIEAKRDNVSFDEMEVSEEELAAANEDVIEDTHEEVKELHEKLPDVAADMAVEAPSETTEA